MGSVQWPPSCSNALDDEGTILVHAGADIAKSLTRLVLVDEAGFAERRREVQAGRR